MSHKTWLMVEFTEGSTYRRESFEVGDGAGVGHAKVRILSALDEIMSRPGCAGFSVSAHEVDCDHEST